MPHRSARSSRPPTRPAATAAAARGCRPMEGLEARVLLSVTTDADGWTVIGKSSDTRVVYVSATRGSDNNSGLSSSSPVRSIAKGKSLIRSGRPDWLLLERGSVWKERIGTWSKSGRSATEPIVIGAYGTGARPLIKTGNETAFNTNGSKLADNIAIIGLSFHAHTVDPYSADYNGTTPSGSGVRIVGPSDNILIEDCAFDAYKEMSVYCSVRPAPDMAKCHDLAAVVAGSVTAVGGALLADEK